MSIRKRIICFFKGHDVKVFKIGLYRYNIEAECNRCGYRLSEEEAYAIVHRSVIG